MLVADMQLTCLTADGDILQASSARRGCRAAINCSTMMMHGNASGPQCQVMQARQPCATYIHALDTLAEPRAASGSPAAQARPQQRSRERGSQCLPAADVLQAAWCNACTPQAQAEGPGAGAWGREQRARCQTSHITHHTRTGLPAAACGEQASCVQSLRRTHHFVGHCGATWCSVV